jgi:glycosyltransferase involved in cell wall biosynthesis
MKSIKYIGFYDTEHNIMENRNSCLAAKNKMNYIAEVLCTLGLEVELTSPSWTYNNTFYKGKKIQLNNNILLVLCPTLPWTSYKLLKALSIVFSSFWLLFYLVCKTKEDESVIVYHSLWLSYPVYFAKKIIGFKFILQVEEIYQDVKKHSRCLEKQEYKIINAADKYIFSTEMLNERVNLKNKPYSVIYGTYQVEEDLGVKVDDGKIHVVYAGTFDPRKGGALAAAAAAEFLPENYHVHIIGFGSNDDKNILLKKIDAISKIAKANVTYDGLLMGEEYIQFLQKCHIGLSTQNPDAEYNDTSFPSKILSYMANGLRVVTVRIKAIETSAIGDKVFYYDQQNPKDIAGAIMSIDFNEPYDSRNIIKKLDAKFLNEIKSLLKD